MVDLIPDGILDRMMRDGRVPSEVHRLIESYRELKLERSQKGCRKGNGKRERRHVG